VVTKSPTIQENLCLQTQPATTEEALGLTNAFEEAAKVNAENSNLLPERTNSVSEQNLNRNTINFGDDKFQEPIRRGNEFRTVWCERDDCPCALFDENFPDAPVIMLAGNAGANQRCQNCVKKNQNQNQT
jgi:hypothetical protein